MRRTRTRAGSDLPGATSGARELFQSNRKVFSSVRAGQQAVLDGTLAACLSILLSMNSDSTWSPAFAWHAPFKMSSCTKSDYSRYVEYRGKGMRKGRHWCALSPVRAKETVAVRSTSGASSFQGGTSWASHQGLPWGPKIVPCLLLPLSLSRAIYL